MNTLLDMIREAQDGKAFDNMARQFQLSQEQAQAAVTAVLPAFQMGLQRQAESADMMGNFLRNLAGGGAAPPSQPEPEPQPQAQKPEAGGDLLAMLFGNRDVADAVAAQAAQFAGVPRTIMANMMPMLASMIMSGLMKNMMNQGYGQWLSQMGGAMMAGMPGRAPQTPQEMFAQMMGVAPPQSAGMFENIGAMMDSVMGTGRPPEPENPMQQGYAALTGMFDAGAKVQQAHLEGLAGIFNAMLQPKDKG